jgi:hypothetical protein
MRETFQKAVAALERIDGSQGLKWWLYGGPTVGGEVLHGEGAAALRALLADDGAREAIEKALPDWGSFSEAWHERLQGEGLALPWDFRVSGDDPGAWVILAAGKWAALLWVWALTLCTRADEREAVPKWPFRLLRHDQEPVVDTQLTTCFDTLVASDPRTPIERVAAKPWPLVVELRGALERAAGYAGEGDASGQGEGKAAAGEDARLTARELAEHFDISYEKLRARLGRWRKKHGEGWYEANTANRTEPRITYRIGDVRAICMRLREGRQEKNAPIKRPSTVP